MRRNHPTPVRRHFPAFVAIASLFITASASACPGCSASTFCCLPGFGLMGMHVGLALAIFAALLERPFFRLAGAEQRTLGFAIQANLFSMIITGIAGLFVMGVAWPGGDGLMLLWMPVAIAINAGVEYAWLRVQCGFVRFRWFIVGNLFSSAIVFTLPIWRGVFGTDSYAYILRIQRHQPTIALSTLAACALIFVLAFALAHRIIATRGGRGFEVLPVKS